MAVTAHVLSLNAFGMPKVCNNVESIYTNLIYLIMLEKGKFLSHPDMGVDIRRRYRFNNDINLLNALQRDISNQVAQYLPELSVIDIAVTMKNEILGIIINTEKGAYSLEYNTTTNAMNASPTYELGDL